MDMVSDDAGLPLRWGATINAHAVEGGDFHADWWRWEQRPARIRDGSTSEVASDHINRYKSDLDLGRKFGFTTMRYALSWARIEPERGHYDEAALKHYGNVFREMATRGIRPIGVLQEHSLPAWFSRMGAWVHADASALFAAYTRRVLDVVGHHCDTWLPHGDPLLWMAMTYGEKAWPVPTGRAGRVSVMTGLADAHAAARKVLKEHANDNTVGISLYVPRFRPADGYSPWDERVARHASNWYSDQFRACFDRAKVPVDFIALHCPGELSTHFSLGRPRSGWMRFEQNPSVACTPDEATPNAEALLELGRAAGANETPLLLSAGGVATEDDTVRCHQLLDHLSVCLQLRDEGVPLLGFCFHTFLDGFSWQHGLTRRQGLVHVDWKTLARTPNPSAFLYQDIIRAGAIRSGAVARYAPQWKRPSREMP